MKKRLLILLTVLGVIILMGGLLTYGMGIHEIVPVPRPDLIVVGTSLIVKCYRNFIYYMWSLRLIY